jgi:hypothetical protein
MDGLVVGLEETSGCLELRLLCCAFLPFCEAVLVVMVAVHLLPPSSHTIRTTVDDGWFSTIEQYSTTYGLQFHLIPLLSVPKLAYLRWGGRGAPPTPSSSHSITTTVGGGWFSTMGLHSTTFGLQLHPIPLLSEQKLAYLRWGGRGALPTTLLQLYNYNHR